MKRALAFVLGFVLAAACARADDYFLATSYFRQGKHQKALEAIDRLEKAEGPAAVSPSLLFVKAQCLASLERPTEALETLEELLRKHPNSSFSANARAKLAQVLEDQKNYRALIDKLQAWVQEDGGQVWAKVLARAYVKDNRPQDAIKFLEASADPRAVELLFEVLNEAGKLDAYLKESAPKAGSTFEALRRHGVLHGLKKDWARARELLDGARALKPQDPELLARSIALAQEAKDLPRAIEYARELTALEPGNAGHVKRLGQLQLAAGDSAGALGTWNQLRTRNPRDRQAHLLYVTVLADHGMLDEAITGVDGARKVFETSALFAEELGNLHARKGNAYEATTEFLRLSTGDSTDKAPTLILGLVKKSKPKSAPSTGPTTTTTPAPQTPDSRLRTPSYPALAPAVRAVEDAIRARPTAIELYYLLDDLLQLEPDEEKIRKLGKDLVAANHLRTDLVVKAARDFAAERRSLEARVVLREVLPHLTPGEVPDATLELAKLERLAGNPDGALELLGKLESGQVSPGAALALRTLAAETWLVDKKDSKKAREIVTELTAKNPAAREVTAWRYLLARCMMANLQFTEAAKLLAEVETKAEGVLIPEISFRLSQLLLMADRGEEARDRLQELVVKYPASTLAQGALRDLFLLATRKAELAQSQEAQQPTTGTASPSPSPAPSPVPSPVASAAASLLSTDTVTIPAKPTLLAEYFLQRHALETGRLDELDRRIAAIDPAKVPPGMKLDFQLLAAQAQRARGQPAKAAEAIETLIKGLSETPVLEDAMLLLAEIHEKDLSDRAKADGVLQEYLMLFPASVKAEEVRRKLEGDGPGTVSAQGETSAQ